MTLALDTSEALQTPEQIWLLVEAVYKAPSREQESRSIEWKRSWNLRESARDRFSAAKHILGFANRDPEMAARAFAGSAYIVAGVEPGAADGVAHEDSATMTDWLSGYLGADGPLWTPRWVNFANTVVLVIAVEAPLPGHPIHSLRRAFEGFAPGRVFIRREGQTGEANPEELKMLQGRLLAAQGGSSLAGQLDLIGRMSEQLNEIAEVAWSEALDPSSVPVLPPNNIRLSPIPRLCTALEVSMLMFESKGGDLPPELIEFARQSKSLGASRTHVASEAGMLISRLQNVITGERFKYQR